MRQVFTILLSIITLNASCSQSSDSEQHKEKLPSVTLVDSSEDYSNQSITIIDSTAKSVDQGFIEVEVIGLYSRGFEQSCLKPCGSDERWWVASMKDSVHVAHELWRECSAIAGDNGTRGEWIYVHLIGLRSEPGRYGHFGGGDRLFKVKKIIEIRKPTDQDCN
jgi:hypothetical protein